MKPLDAKVSQDQIGFVYDKLSGVYDIWGRMTESAPRDRAIELAQIEDGKNILEVAVGTGLAFHEIVKRNPHGHNVGIGLSAGMLEKAKFGSCSLAMRRESCLMKAMCGHASDDAMETSRSWASRRQRLIQDSVRSTTHRLATRTKPFAPYGRLTISIAGPFISARALSSFSLA